MATNPWLKKNPAMSLWLSGANAMLAVARSRASAEAMRQATTASTLAARQMAEIWATTMFPGAAAAKKKRRR